MNEILNDTFREDIEDLKAFDERENEQSISFSGFLKEVEKKGKS